MTTTMTEYIIVYLGSLYWTLNLLRALFKRDKSLHSADFLSLCVLSSLGTAPSSVEVPAVFAVCPQNFCIACANSFAVREMLHRSEVIFLDRKKVGTFSGEKRCVYSEPFGKGSPLKELFFSNVYPNKCNPSKGLSVFPLYAMCPNGPHLRSDNELSCQDAQAFSSLFALSCSRAC